MPPENEQYKKPPGSIKDTFKDLANAIWNWFKDLMDLQKGLDREGTIISIKNNKKVAGANAWLLICSIMIASLGLDLNSPAIIIGAMLISPLMSPILGVGLAIGINDRNAFFTSLTHFGISIVIALVTSIIYFKITPLGQLTNEIQSRTEPTFLDGLVAIFGGLAGIISVSRKDSSNAIPGVAIATALMPPLCVTGYGIANANWAITLNSFYLFFLNSSFIAIATLLVVRLLKFPFKKHIDTKDARRTRLVLGIFTLIIIIPGTQLLYKLYSERQETIKVGSFIQEYFDENSETKCLDYTVLNVDTTKQIILSLLGKSIPEDSLDSYYNGLEKHQLGGYELNLIQNRELDLKEISKMQLQLENLGQMATQLQTVSASKHQQEKELTALRRNIDSLAQDSMKFSQVFQLSKAAFPDLEEIGYANARQTNFKKETQQGPVFFIKWNKNKRLSERKKEEQRLYEFFKVSAKLDTMRIITY